MTSRLAFTARLLPVLLLALASDPLRCGIPRAQSATTEFGPSIMITEGKSPQGYPYMHGGVGSAEREAMEQRGTFYNVKLSFADKRGPYVASVKLLLQGADRKEIVNLTTDGPWFYIELPPGTYTVQATLGAKSSGIKVLKVPKYKKIQQTLIWDLGEEQDPVVTR